MLFGLKINQIKTIFFIGFTLALASGCKDDPGSKYSSFLSPEGGNSMAVGIPLSISIHYAKDKQVDSVVYLIDTAKVLSVKDTVAKKIKTDGLKLGNHLLTAKIYSAGTSEDLTANFILLASKAPVAYTYKIINKFPHDTASYVEGLEYHDGYFYESAGDYGHSSLRKVDVKTGKVLQQVNLDAKYFGEGITVIGDKIIQLTYKEGVGFIYDKATFKKLGEFPYTAGREGWGLAFDGQKILNTDGSNTIFFLDKNTYQKIGSIDVFDDKDKIENLNELEYINGKIYANVYTTNTILIINPETGAVEGKIDLSGLLPQGYFKTADEIGNNVLNGIAYDRSTQRLFVAGKKWPNIFEIKMIEKQ